jgi:hypothetical protein
VLTDDDLNRLENYVIGKNRLHNRHLHGSGVVCGLEVVCDPCSSTNVTVRTGYALSPCGDDIVVCKDASVNICDLINRCRPQSDNCDPYGQQQPSGCMQGIHQWVLSVCYSETPSRGVQPLMSEPCSCKCGGSCGCGGGSGGSCGCGGSSGGSSSSGCGCGCGGGKSSSANTSSAKSTRTVTSGNRKYNAQCEPTLICEGATFTATRYVDPKRRQPVDPQRFGAWGLLAAKADQFGPLLTRVLACYLKAAEIRDAYANLGSGPLATVVAAYSEYREALRDFAAAHAAHRCDLMRELLSPEVQITTQRAIDPATGAYVNAGANINWPARFAELNRIWLELFRDCFCSALLPPCPDVESGNCVPLAVVTIDAESCRVIEICNWKAREFALTLPTLYYWTSFIQWGALKDVIARLCCDDLNSRTWLLLFSQFEKILSNNKTLNANVRAAATATTQPNGATTTEPEIPAAATATMQALGAMLEQVTMPDGMARLLSVTQPPLARTTQEVADMQASIAELRRTVAEQGELIQKLAAGRG